MEDYLAPGLQNQLYFSDKMDFEKVIAKNVGFRLDDQEEQTPKNIVELVRGAW